jgi:alkaline phosphatase
MNKIILKHRKTVRFYKINIALMILIQLTACSLTQEKSLSVTEKNDSNQIKPRNVILFIGDGMGPSTVTAIQILDGQQKGETGEENVLPWETFPHLALSKTYNTNQQVPDSAGTATAMLTGNKTKAGMISVGPNSLRGSCQPNEEVKMKTVLELAENNGLSTGVVTTTRLTHATPASSYAHSSERNWEYDAAMPKEIRDNGCRDIALQFVESQFVESSVGDGIDVAFGC